MSVTERKLTRLQKLGFISLTLLVIGIFASQWISHRQHANAHRATARAYALQVEANAMLAAMMNMETDARGYLSTGHDAFLDPLRGNLKAFAEHWLLMKQLAHSDPEQWERLDRIKAEMAAWYSSLLERAFLNSEQQSSADEHHAQSEATLNAIRQRLLDVSAAEHAAALAQSSRAETLRDAADAVLLVCGAVSTLLSVALAHFVLRPPPRINSAPTSAGYERPQIGRVMALARCSVIPLATRMTAFVPPIRRRTRRTSNARMLPMMMRLAAFPPARRGRRR